MSNSPRSNSSGTLTDLEMASDCAHALSKSAAAYIFRSQFREDGGERRLTCASKTAMYGHVRNTDAPGTTSTLSGPDSQLLLYPAQTCSTHVVQCSRGWLRRCSRAFQIDPTARPPWSTVSNLYKEQGVRSGHGALSPGHPERFITAK